MLSTTLAVLRPAPGNDSISARVRGTSPPKSVSNFCDNAITFFALVRSSSPLGSGLAFWKRSKASRTSAGVQGFEPVVFDGFDFLLDFLAGRATLPLAVDWVFAPFFDPVLDPFLGTDRTRAFLARWARM